MQTQTLALQSNALFDPLSSGIAARFVEFDAGRRLSIAIIAAGAFSLLSCTAFYLFEIERLTSRQLAALTQRMERIIKSGEDGQPKTRGERQTGGVKRQWRLDAAWLADHAESERRLFLLRSAEILATSPDDASAGEIAALEPDYHGRLARNGHLFIQGSLRWDDRPDSPTLVVQEPLSVPFSLGEIAAAGLFLWGILAGLIWLTVGIWLKDALNHIQYLAYHDALTGLINRAALRIGLPHMMAESRRNGAVLAALYLDLDHFKTINDSLGHAVGDLVLKEIACRLHACTRDTDFLARLGGDEFVIVSGELNDANDAASIARKIVEALSAPIVIDKNSLQIGASIGIATHPGSAADPDAFIRQADSAMSAAKQLGRGRYHYYDESLGKRADQRLQLELQMRQAIADDAFELHYQPIVAANGRQLYGFEALIRWERQGKAISPVDFIPLAEETGLIAPLGAWALRSACRQLRQWQLQYPLAAACSVSVNVSVAQLQVGNFVEVVSAALKESGLPPASLILELTESLYVDSHTTIPAILRDLRGLGVRLAMDDFGTGYSALASLSRLPIDRLKIDRSLIASIVSNPEELAIARTIIAIGKQLGLEIVAEGVETAEQASILSCHGCHILQGWLYGRAEAAETAATRFFENAFPPLSDESLVS